ncbi:Ubiquinone biosynthesis O-methyltransferase, mitochondrial [Methylobacterium adhaesivum]|uniref:SAM-dependent methyltransferase n=1 Tax=Methylobacterium adhaesivum TaxID=333297 RepID=A0ABT8BF99_9HYPH|nr:SAM-dependent methyltransferase [Methylobacterium adhaesivum]MDN3590225.1 SAM-dependent methyltransferase [Methylobacterium adhaesivum]GJD31080.1 Ubiquinone biosynthesis O-methyltransferase, mitochondrial [Methylobacterium adhaesivum]
MTRSSASLPPGYFDGIYAGNPDPWGFTTSAYEGAKYDATLAALSEPTYAEALEVGCSIGVLTRRLAERCTRLLALDVAETALAAARARCAETSNVSFLRAAVPEQWPPGRFDLIVLSEVLYFFTKADLDRLAGHMVRAVKPGAEVILVHWTGETDYPSSGDEAVEALIAGTAGTLAPHHHTRAEKYRLDVLRARAAP